ncbi:zinc ribbon domain-containing protein [Methylophilus glucosoxydans]|uniref:Zinc ribbon domain-containing protein n=1 Tax=Methylophilus glucosoxydans TaxID=752553 RepID=A0ABW3GPB1_9PROT
MPLYDFQCSQCGKTQELLLKLNTSAPACPHCGGTLQKQVSRLAEPGKTAGIIASARAQAKREGHFSNYAAAERKKL